METPKTMQNEVEEFPPKLEGKKESKFIRMDNERESWLGPLFYGSGKSTRPAFFSSCSRIQLGRIWIFPPLL